ncbi:MAG: type I restriction endonuclease [Opitutaceae bacterium]
MRCHELRDRGTRFFLCQFKPEHDLNPAPLARYAKNRLRIVPELVYSPGATDAEFATTGLKAKAYRIDLVLFVNGIPVATLELKSEFNQAADRAIKQYKSARLPADPVTKKAEPPLTFKRGALVHFAVSQYEVAMTTRLAGESTVFPLSIAEPKTAARATKRRRTSTATPPTTSGTKCCCPTTCSTSSPASFTSKSRKRRTGTAGSISRRR